MCNFNESGALHHQSTLEQQQEHQESLEQLVNEPSIGRFVAIVFGQPGAPVYTVRSSISRIIGNPESESLVRNVWHIEPELFVELCSQRSDIETEYLPLRPQWVKPPPRPKPGSRFSKFTKPVRSKPGSRFSESSKKFGKI